MVKPTPRLRLAGSLSRARQPRLQSHTGGPNSGQVSNGLISVRPKQASLRSTSWASRHQGHDSAFAVRKNLEATQIDWGFQCPMKGFRRFLLHCFLPFRFSPRKSYFRQRHLLSGYKHVKNTRSPTDLPKIAIQCLFQALDSQSQVGATVHCIPRLPR